MSDAPVTSPDAEDEDDIILELIEATENHEFERADQLLDALRIFADYEDVVIETLSVMAPGPQNVANQSEKMSTLPTLAEFIAIRGIKN